MALVALVGYCTKHLPLQHPNIKLPCNSDKGTTGGMTNDSPVTAEFPAVSVVGFFSSSLCLSNGAELWSDVVFILGPDI